MVTSGLDRRLNVYDIRAFKPLHKYFLPAGASCLSLSQRGLLSAATGDIVQVHTRKHKHCQVSSTFLIRLLTKDLWRFVYNNECISTMTFRCIGMYGEEDRYPSPTWRIV